MTGFPRLVCAAIQPCTTRMLALLCPPRANPLTSLPSLPSFCCAAVRDKYRTHAWFCVANTTPFDRLPSVLLSGAEPADARPKGVQAGAAASAGAAAAAAARGRA